MSTFISEYSVNFKVTNIYLLGAVIGEGGRNQRCIEKKTGAKINIKEDVITINGESMDEVKTAEKVVLATISAHIFVVELGDSFVGQIIGTNGDKLSQLTRTTKAHISISKKETNKDSRKLEIIGNTRAFKLAKVRVLDEIERKIQSQIRNENPRRCFRNHILSKGVHEPEYVIGQLPPNPQLFFLQFEAKLIEGEKMYVEGKADLGLKNPPMFVGKNSAVLAPFNGYLFRAKVLAVRRSEDKEDILLNVQFVDFGNLDWVSYFDCENLQNEYLYPTIATPCQISNLKQEAWENKSLKLFRQYMNDFTKNIKVKLTDAFNKNELVSVDVSIKEVGDIGDILVENGDAEWKNSPFEPIYVQNTQNRIGSVEILYEKEGYGGCIALDVSAICSAFPSPTEKFTYTSHLESNSILDSIKTAYTCSKKYLESKNSDFLDTHTLHFSVQSKFKFDGCSAGAAITLGILSECFGREIPSEIAITGAITGHGLILGVGKLREKLLGARDYGKRIVYIPEVNHNEALEIRTDDIEVKPIKDIFTLLDDIWK